MSDILKIIMAGIAVLLIASWVILPWIISDILSELNNIRRELESIGRKIH